MAPSAGSEHQANSRTELQGAVMEALAELGGKATARQICGRAGIADHTAAQVLLSLKRAGAVERSEDRPPLWEAR